MNRKLWMNLQKAAVSLGIAVKTLRRWDKAGKLHVARMAGHHRRIGMAEIQRLQRQVVQTIAEYASSLGAKHRGMKKRLSLVEQQAVAAVLLDYPDRLVRFGFSGKRSASRAHANPRCKKALPMLVWKPEQEERAA